LTNQKKPPPANVDELKARLGLVKKPGKPKASPGASPQAGPGPAAPGIQGPPGVAPPPFLQAQKKKADMHRDPFARDVGTEYVRQSLVDGPRQDDLTISVEDQKKMARRSRIMTIIVAVAIGIACMILGVFWGRGFSSRLIYNLSVEDGKFLYGVLEHSSKTLSDIKAKIVSAQQKANKSRMADYKLMAELKALAKSEGCLSKGEPDEICVLRLADLANRSYNIYKPDIVQLLFTYSSQWNELFMKMKDHAYKTKNDKAALDQTQKKIEKLSIEDYGLVFTMKKDPQMDLDVLYGNLAIIEAPVIETDGTVSGFTLQGGVGYPGVDKTLYWGGDLAAEPEKWVVPLGPESKEGIIARTQMSHFIEYQIRLQVMIELANQMDMNQKALLMSIGEIASLDKQFAF